MKKRVVMIQLTNFLIILLISYQLIELKLFTKPMLHPALDIMDNILNTVAITIY